MSETERLSMQAAMEVDVALAVLGILVWAVIATLAMSSLMFVSQFRGWSRLDLPLLLGSLFTGDRESASLLGFLLNFAGGCLIAFLYYFAFAFGGSGAGWPAGLVAGLVHGLVSLTVFLPVLSHIHPRLALEHDGAGVRRRLEPPGFLALNYGYRTPLVALAAHAVYGTVLGAGFRLLV